MNPPTEELSILYEDRALIAVAKPAGLHVFPSRSGERRSVWALLGKVRPELDGVGDPASPAVVHRLDRGTSGVLLVAKDDRSYKNLREAFEQGKIEKYYLALVEGILSGPVRVDLPIGSRYRRSQKVQVQIPGRRLRGVRPAGTSVKPLASSKGLTLCQVQIQTGVRHQIRAHLGHIGHPLVGDRQYGARGTSVHLKGRLFLHAWRIKLRHPDTGHPLAICCPPPDELMGLLEGLGMPVQTCP